MLDIKFVGRTSRGHIGGRSHRTFHPPFFDGACFYFFLSEGSSHSFLSSTVKLNFVYERFNRSPTVGHSFISAVRKISFAWVELTPQRVRGSFDYRSDRQYVVTI